MAQCNSEKEISIIANNVASKEVMDALREYVLSKGEHIKIDYNYEEDIASKEVRDAINNLFQEVEKKGFTRKNCSQRIN